MSDREKLIELFFDYQEKYNSLVPSKDGLADHLLANGVIVLPCKVGDTVWFDTYKHGEMLGIQPHKVEKILVSVQIGREYAEPYTELPDWSFGKTVFLTRETAEAALRKENK